MIFAAIAFTILFLFVPVSCLLSDNDESFISWCHCMGRFGNQVDQFLGGLRIAKQLNRTLVVPPFVEYIGRSRRYVPFEEYFNMSRLAAYHRVLSMENFFRRYGHDDSWNRTAFCIKTSTFNKEECDMRRGQPSTDFWDLYDVQFDESVHYEHFQLTQPQVFSELYPASQYPVVLLQGCPGAYPVLAKDRKLQRHVVFRDDMLQESLEQIQDLPRPILSVHIRNGLDWQRACQHGVGEISFMESPQCLDPVGNDTIHENMCYPSQNFTVISVRRVAVAKGAQSVYIATDKDSWTIEVRKELRRHGHGHVLVQTSPFTGDNAYIQDLVVLSTTDFFLGNCISSFTGFAARYRRHVNMLDTFFVGLNYTEDDVDDISNRESYPSRREEVSIPVDEFGYHWHDYYEQENRRAKACYILPNAGSAVSETSLDSTEKDFFDECDYGAVNKLRREMKYEFHRKNGAESSTLVCTGENSVLCHGKNVMLHFPDKIESGTRDWREEKKMIELVDDNDEESTYDLRISRPTIVLKPDSHANFYHAMCDFSNLYLSSHVVDSIEFSDSRHTKQELKKTFDLLVWTDRTQFRSKFDVLYRAWIGLDGEIITASSYAGKKVYFDELLLSLNPRGTTNNFFYNMYVPGMMRPLDDKWARGSFDVSCSGSDFFVDFLDFINRNNAALVNTADDYMKRSDRPLVVRMLSRSSGTGATSGTRKLLNEQEVLMAVREKYSDQQVDISIVDFDWSQQHTIEKQMETFQACDVLFGMHGAGLANMLFMPRWSSVVEAYNCDDDWCYSDLSRLSGFSYFRATEADVERFKPAVEVKESHQDHKKYFDYKIDVAVALRLIENAMGAVIRHKDSPFDANSKSVQDILRLDTENPHDPNVVKPYHILDEL